MFEFKLHFKIVVVFFRGITIIVIHYINGRWFYIVVVVLYNTKLMWNFSLYKWKIILYYIILSWKKASLISWIMCTSCYKAFYKYLIPIHKIKKYYKLLNPWIIFFFAIMLGLQTIYRLYSLLLFKLFLLSFTIFKIETMNRRSDSCLTQTNYMFIFS